MKKLFNVLLVGLLLVTLVGCGKQEKSSNIDKETIKSEYNNSNYMTMKVKTNDDEFTIDNYDKVFTLYNKLSNLEYKVTDDKSLNNGLLIYFYDKNGNMLKMFVIEDNYLKLDGMPDTYKIEDDNFNYNDLVEEISKIK